MWKNWGRDHIRDVPKVTQSPNPTWLVFKVEYVYSMVIKRIQREKGKILNAHNILCVCVCTFYFVHSIFAETCALKIFLVIMPFQNHLLTTLLKLWPTPGPDFPSSPFWHPSNPDISGTEHIQLCQSTEHTLSLSAEDLESKPFQLGFSNSYFFICLLQNYIIPS